MQSGHTFVKFYAGGPDTGVGISIPVYECDWVNLSSFLRKVYITLFNRICKYQLLFLYTFQLRLTKFVNIAQVERWETQRVEKGRIHFLVTNAIALFSPLQWRMHRVIEHNDRSYVSEDLGK